MADADKLAEVGGYAVWRRRNDGQDGGRSDGQQVSNAGGRGGRNRTGTAGSGCGTERHMRNRSYRIVLLLRQGPDLHLRLGGAIRTEPAHQPGLVHAWRRQGSSQRILQEI